MKAPIAQKLWSLRESMNLTQDEFAELCGLSRSSIARYELGNSTPNRIALEKIAAATHTSVAELLGESVPTDAMTETLYRRPGMRVLFDAVRDAPDEVLQQTIDIIEVLKNGKKK